MERKDKSTEPNALTDEDFKEFLSADGDEQWKILLAHAERNEKILNEQKRQAKSDK